MTRKEMTKSKLALMCTVVAAICNALAHTPAETNAVVVQMLKRAMYYGSLDDFGPVDAIRPVTPNMANPDDFFYTSSTGTWTAAEKRIAFEEYLSGIPEKFHAMSEDDRQLARTAISACGLLCMTNSIKLLRPLVFEEDRHWFYSRGLIGRCVKMGGVNDEMTDFVERILTNGVSFAMSEKAEAIREYTRLLRNPGITNLATSAEIGRAVSMLYRNRHCNWGSGYALDMAFSNCVEGYSMSSNRLELAQSVLSVTNCWPQLRNTFVSITNELLSSGRPLVQLEIEGELPVGSFE